MIHFNSAKDNLAELQAGARWLGRIFTVLAMLMTSSAYYALGGDSFFAGLILAGVGGAITYAAATLLSHADVALSFGSTRWAGALFGFWLMFMVAEFFGHTMFSVSHRVSDVKRVELQNTTYEDVRDSVAKANLDLEQWQKRRDEFLAQKPWAATVTATGLRAQLGPAAEAIRQEEARGGCGPRCLGLQKQKAELEAQIAAAEQLSTIDQKIALANGMIATAKAKAEKTTTGDGVAFSSSRLVSQMGTLSLNPSEDALQWSNIGIGAYISFMLAIAAAVFNFLGYKDWKTLEREAASDAVAPRTTNPLQPQIDDLKAMMLQMAAALQPKANAAVALPQPQQEPMQVHLHEADKLADLNGTLAALKRLAAQPQLRVA